MTASVTVAAKGALSFERMALQGSKAQAGGFWPPRVPLLLSAFRLQDSGRVSVRDATVRRRRRRKRGGLVGRSGRCYGAPPPIRVGLALTQATHKTLLNQTTPSPLTAAHGACHDNNGQVRVPNAAALLAALRELPGGETAAPETPDLRPRFAGGRPPAPGAEKFVIDSWTVRQQRGAQPHSWASLSLTRENAVMFFLTNGGAATSHSTAATTPDHQTDSKQSTTTTTTT